MLIAKVASPRFAHRFKPVDPRSEIKRLLRAAGEPPAAPDDLAAGVWSRIARPQRPPDRAWSWLPRGWEIAVVLLTAVLAGVLSAEWRLQRQIESKPPHALYLARIDPTMAREEGSQ